MLPQVLYVMLVAAMLLGGIVLSIRYYNAILGSDLPNWVKLLLL